MALFKIDKKSVAGIESYVLHNYRYFMRDTTSGVKITIGKQYITIHITEYYCVICNDLSWLYRNGKLIVKQRSLDWLKKYGHI